MILSNFLTLNPEAVHIWIAQIQQVDSQIKQLTSLLAASEQKRAQNFQFEKHRRAFIASRGYLRLILSKYVEIPPQNLEFNYTPKGKPYLATQSQNNNWQFNVSHSQDLILYALTQDRLIGIDVEYLRPFPDAVKLAERFFAPSEAAFINKCPESIQPLAFFQGWTSKEAILKAMGEGIGGGLETIEVELDPSKETQLFSLDGDQEAAKNWSLTKIKTSPEYMATLAVKGKIDYKVFDIKDLEVYFAQNS